MRPARINGPIDVGPTMMVLAAETDVGQLQVRIGLGTGEGLRTAAPYLSDEDRQDAALLELEQLCTADRIRQIDGHPVVDITAADVDRIVARLNASIRP